jgi:hypothetical protein
LDILKGEKFVGFNQLGRVLAKRPEFYQCQVKRYYDFFHAGAPKPDEKVFDELASRYQEHQDGLKLFEQLLNLKRSEEEPKKKEDK